ncbi:energy-coupling factor transporter transmembrane protein EcfT [Haloimpatiens sp. FM7315]|uniref:energy-coupling factor transporter transmembrane component T family protein n=1 Tax=Haloimpatiens sp. FM7315 TaxID=3298609 RepID=UPI0035A33489
MLTYRNRNSFLQKLHPLSGVLLIFLYLIVFIIIDNPIYLAIIFSSFLLLSFIDGSLKELLNYGKLIAPFAFMIIVLNPILVKNGQTVIYEGKINYPLLGPVRITLEATLYGLLTGIRVICVTFVFGFGNLVIHPDRAFSYFSRYFKNSSLLMNMTIRLFPSIIKSYENIKSIEKVRGNDISSKNLKKRIISYGNIINILFLSSMEDSSDIAEAMYSRGYGVSRKRNTYFKEKFKLRDMVIIGVTLVGFIYLKFLRDKGLTELSFYPLLENPIRNLNLYGGIFCGILLIPSLISWGWQYGSYKYKRSKF